MSFATPQKRQYYQIVNRSYLFQVYENPPECSLPCTGMNTVKIWLPFIMPRLVGVVRDNWLCLETISAEYWSIGVLESRNLLQV
jgi:hypothetical protein